MFIETARTLRYQNSLLVSVLILALVCGCVEEFVPETESFESALVIEATITNELKQHEILLSRSFRFEATVPNPESGASVKIIDDTQGEYTFEETDPGKYVSSTPFSTQMGRNYTLNVTTSDGRRYASEAIQLTPPTAIEEVYAERLVNDNGIEGISIFVDSFDPSGNSKFYRYEYEETYKIIAPDWKSEDLAADPVNDPNDVGDDCNVVFVQGNPDEKVCYASTVSNTIILTSTQALDVDRVARFPVRFIDRNDYIISHRYSILVRQYTQNSEAFTFFKTLRDFSGSGNLFSDTQPGFFSGNVFSKENENEKVLGYFDIASVTEKRFFFDYKDFFPGEELPPYAINCEPLAPAIAKDGTCILRPLVETNAVRYLNENVNPRLDEGPHLVVPRACGDCTALGTIEVPEFWIE